MEFRSWCLLLLELLTAMGHSEEQEVVFLLNGDKASSEL